jgi:hypothetical protein
VNPVTAIRASGRTIGSNRVPIELLSTDSLDDVGVTCEHLAAATRDTHLQAVKRVRMWTWHVMYDVMCDV